MFNKENHELVCDEEGCIRSVGRGLNSQDSYREALIRGWNLSYTAENGAVDLCPEHG